MPLDQTQQAHDFELSLAAERPFDIQDWFGAWRREYVFFRIDLHGRINFVAPSVKEILGYEPAEMLGRNYREFFDLDDPLIAQALDLCDDLGASDPMEIQRSIARRKDGRSAFFSLREREITGPGGLIGKEVLGQDVTARVEAELSLRQSERKYRRLVEGLKSDYIIYARDAQGLLTYVSPSVEKVLGFPPEELIGRYAYEVFAQPDAARAAVDQFTRESEAGKHLHKFVGEIQRRDGSMCVLEVQARPVFDFDGRFVAMEGIAKDVTEPSRAAEEIRRLKEDLERRVALRTEELQRMNEELRASEARYREVVDAQTEFIVRWRPDGTRTFVNDAYCRFQKATAEELLGRQFLLVIHSDDRAAFEESIASMSTAKPSSLFEGRIRLLHGGYAWMQWETRALFDAEGRPCEYQSVGRDVTELKAAGDLLRQKEAHLAHLSRLATMGEMVAGIAHEVSQPLHAAKIFAEAARRNLQSGGADRVNKAIECTAEISQAITRTVQIIRRLREYTRAQPFQVEQLSVNELLRDALELVAYEVRRVGVAAKLNLAAPLPKIVGDRIQLEQLLVNLLKNACEAMEQTELGKRILQISAAAGEGSVCLSIRDAGVGISAAEVPRLFEAFYTTKPEGMGMGLVLCKSIADAHGIDLRFEKNEDGPGVTFRLTIPIKKAPYA
jgi:PAS domain S-box-containing protein